MKTEIPDRISCSECRAEGKGIIHSTFSTMVDEMPNGPWSWNIMEHDMKTVLFEWPHTFETKADGITFVQNLLNEAKDSLGDTVV